MARRKATPEEVTQWAEWAASGGEVSADAIEVDRNGERGLRITFTSPIPSAAYSADLVRRTPPHLFDRDSDGQILFPGSWLADLLERIGLSEPWRGRAAWHGRLHERRVRNKIERVREQPADGYPANSEHDSRRCDCFSRIRLLAKTNRGSFVY